MPRATSVTSATVCASARLHPARLAIAALLLAAATAGEARADDADTCATASEQGQELRDQGKLRAALELFVQCAAATCPAIVRNDCAPWVTQVQAKLPTVAFRARDGEGHDITDVRVSVDGEEIAGKLDGRALTMDPGTHTFRFNKAGEPEVTRTLLLREGEKGRLVDVVIGAAPPPASGGFSVPVAGWVLGGLSLAGFGAGIGFGRSLLTPKGAEPAPPAKRG